MIIAFLLILGQYVLWAQDHEHALLWRISGNGLEKDSYLFGTIHAICTDDFFFPQAAEKALEASEQLVLELKMDDPMTLLQVQQGMMMPNGLHLRDLMAKEDYQRLYQFFKDSVKIDLTMLGYMKPIALSSLIYPKLMDCQTVSYEIKLMTMVKKQQKEVLGIETVADQLKVFEDIPLERQAKMLLEILDTYSEQAREMQQLIAAYKSQNINALYNNIKKTSFGGESFEQVLLTDRNRRWIDKIMEMSHKKSAFYAIGAGHLGGPNGVITLLREKGFTLDPLL